MDQDTASVFATPLGRPARRSWKPLLTFVATKPLGTIGACVVVGFILLALLAPWVAPYSPDTINRGKQFTSPGAQFLLGSDNLGRDVLSRVIWGTQISLRVGFISVLLGTTGGALLGIVSGYLGGRADFAIQRMVDAFMAFPSFLLALAIVAMFGASEANVIAAVSISLGPQAARTLRSSALAIRETQYIEGARAVGCGQWWIMRAHVLPNCMAPYIIIASTGLSTAILVEATLSFLGLGIPPPAPSWGGMVAARAREFLERAPWMGIAPGAALSLLVFGFNLFGDALRDVLDPRLRKG